MINSFIVFIPQKPLNGAVERKPDTVFRLAGWFSGRYQYVKNDFIEDSYGCRNFFIRVHNQTRYTLADKPTTADVIIGKEGYSYPLEGVQSYTGEKFPGVMKIADQVAKLKFIQDTLAKLKKEFILVFAPGKATYYHEYLPDIYSNSDKLNAYTCYAMLAKTAGLNFIDFNKYFLNRKFKSPYKLYTLNTIHWTKYGSCIAGDSILSFIEKLGGFKLNHPHWDTIVLSEANGSEIENENEMNLLFKLKREQLGHPKLSFKPDTGSNRPSALFVGDSYFSGLKENFKIWNAFSSGDFIYYYKTVSTKNSDSTKDIRAINLKTEIAKTDVIVLITTEVSYPDLGWGFIDDMYGMFKGEDSSTVLKRRVNAMKLRIRNAPEWFHSIELKAKAQGISTDSAVTLNAIWMVEH
jgi:hypothetical protein